MKRSVASDIMGERISCTANNAGKIDKKEEDFPTATAAQIPFTVYCTASVRDFYRRGCLNKILVGPSDTRVHSVTLEDPRVDFPNISLLPVRFGTPH